LFSHGFRHGHPSEIDPNLTPAVTALCGHRPTEELLQFFSHWNRLPSIRGAAYLLSAEETLLRQMNDSQRICGPLKRTL